MLNGLAFWSNRDFGKVVESRQDWEGEGGGEDEEVAEGGGEAGHERTHFSFGKKNCERYLKMSNKPNIIS